MARSRSPRTAQIASSQPRSLSPSLPTTPTRNRHHAGLLRGRGLPRRGTLCGATLASRLVGTSTPRCGRLGIVRLTAGGAAHTFHRPNSLRSPRNRFKIGPDAIYFINVVPESERARAASYRFLCLFNIADVQEVSRSDRIDPVRSLTLRSFQEPRDHN